MTRKFSESHMEKILLRDPHVKSITHDKEWDVPSIDYLLFNEDERELAKLKIISIGAYLNSPYIKDDFKDHGDRQNWRDQMNEKYAWFYDYYKTNSLKFNSILVVSLGLDQIKSAYIGKNRRNLSELVKRKKGIRNKPYYELTMRKKLRYVRQLKQISYDVLTFLSKQSPASSPD